VLCAPFTPEYWVTSPDDEVEQSTLQSGNLLFALLGIQLRKFIAKKCGDDTRLRGLVPAAGGETCVKGVMSEPGLVLVDASLNLIASNAEAIRILAFPERVEEIRHPDLWLASKIRAQLVEHHARSRTIFVKEFSSARRTYSCSSCALSVRANGSSAHPPALVLTLERKSNGGLTVATLSERFGLTQREQETVKLLLQGLTSKEIAMRMGISANTVKAFVRLVMIKMGVSTRSGIAGKMVASET
jgi:DNA-binding CsgD family transcriptional regulator